MAPPAQSCFSPFFFTVNLSWHLFPGGPSLQHQSINQLMKAFHSLSRDGHRTPSGPLRVRPKQFLNSWVRVACSLSSPAGNVEDAKSRAGEPASTATVTLFPLDKSELSFLSQPRGQPNTLYNKGETTETFKKINIEPRNGYK